MLKEASALSEIHPNVVIKLPLTVDGLAASQVLSSKGKTLTSHVLLCKPGALHRKSWGDIYISPFIGRLDDVAKQMGKQLRRLELYMITMAMKLKFSSIYSSLYSC